MSQSKPRINLFFSKKASHTTAYKILRLKFLRSSSEIFIRSYCLPLSNNVHSIGSLKSTNEDRFDKTYGSGIIIKRGIAFTRLSWNKVEGWDSVNR